MSGDPGAMSGQPRPDTGGATNAEPITPPSTDATVIPAGAGAISPTESAATAIAGPDGGAMVIPTPVPAATATAEIAAAAADTAEAAEAGAAPVSAPARRRRLAVLAGLTRLLRFALVLALLAVGVAIGYRSFLTSEPAPTGPVADPATAGNLPAPVVREFIAAVGRNDADAIRSAVPADPYKALTAEMARWEIQQVTKVETLATYEDGQRTTTAFVMIGRDSSRNPVAINLIVETEAGNIVSFK